MSSDKTFDHLKSAEVLASSIHCGALLNIDGKFAYVSHIERLTYDILQFHFNVINCNKLEFLIKSYDMSEILTVYTE